MTKTVKRIKRAISGLLLLDKPEGITSNHALQKIKWLYHAEKAGHVGTLDPFATGLLPICLGEATKFSQFALNADKGYEVRVRLGVRTASGDTEGHTLSERPVRVFSVAELEEAFAQFRGAIKQVPPMTSALKVQGRPLYELARQGITIERAARDIHIASLEGVQIAQDELRLTVQCSKGTYIRSLVDDLGEVLGCGAHAVALRRIRIGNWMASQMIDWERVQTFEGNLQALDQLLLPMTILVQELPEQNVSLQDSQFIMQGRSISTHLPIGLVRLVREDQEFLGIGEVRMDGLVYPKRLRSFLAV